MRLNFVLSIAVSISIFFLFGGYLIFTPISQLSASEKAGQEELLGIKHKEKGINCTSCHEESPPAKATPNSACAKCHDGQEKLDQLTNKVVPNPHASPHLNPGELPACDDCHHIHKSSVNACEQCHENFKFKVP